MSSLTGMITLCLSSMPIQTATLLPVWGRRMDVSSSASMNLISMARGKKRGIASNHMRTWHRAVGGMHLSTSGTLNVKKKGKEKGELEG